MHQHARRHRRLAGAAAAAAVAATTLLFAPSPAVAGAPTADAALLACDGSWDVVPSPSPGGFRDILRAVDARTADDAWAVGSTTAAETEATHPLTIHWDGTGWAAVENGITNAGVLSGVDVVGPDDTWAVGYVAETDFVTRPLAIHWDGHRWNRTPTPRIIPGNLTSVSGTGPNDVWAVGMDRGPDPDAILLHWDGSAWTQSPSPLDIAPDAAVAIQDVIALSPTEAWAVGYVVDANLGQQPLALRWNGERWTKVRVPDTGTYGSALEDVTRTTTGEVWVVGRKLTDAGDQPLALVWRDGAWVSPQQPTGEAARFEGVAPLPGGRLLAVGFQQAGEQGIRALAMVYDGTGWQATPTADVRGDDFFFDVATVPGKPISWAVGDRRDLDVPRTLVERRCG